MSGSGGGDGGPIPPDDIPACEIMVIRTRLVSPNPAVITKLKKGDQLDVAAKSATGPALVLYNGGIAGSIMDSRVLRLLECIEKGYDYIALVQSVSGGSCEVEVRIKGR